MEVTEYDLTKFSPLPETNVNINFVLTQNGKLQDCDPPKNKRSTTNFFTQCPYGNCRGAIIKCNAVDIFSIALAGVVY